MTRMFQSGDPHRALRRASRGGFDAMTLKTTRPLLRLGVVGWLIAAGMGAAAEESALAGQGGTGAQTSQAVESDLALAEQGDARAQGRLAEAYYHASGVALDQEEAVRWARLAAEQGDARGQGILAAAYNTGYGATQDFAQAARWARLAAEQGDPAGQDILGGLYLTGRGVEQDDAEAERWTRLAAEQGYAFAQTSLAMMYMTGRGVERDLVSAYMWQALGAAGRNPDDIGVLLGGLAAAMTPEQVAEAEARVRDWKPTETP